MRNPGFTCVAAATLALGIAATTGMFSIVHAVLLRPLPYPEPERIVQIWQVAEDGRRMNFSGPNLTDVRDATRSFQAIAHVGRGAAASVSGRAEATRVNAIEVSGDFFRVLRTQPALGREFTPDEYRRNGPRAVVISQRLWQDYLGSTPALPGLAVTIQQEIFAVVGVMPPAFAFPLGTDVWVAGQVEGSSARTAHNWQVIARLRDDITIQQAQEETSVIAKRIRAQYGQDTWMTNAAVIPLQEQLVGRTRPALLVLFGAAAALLLIACANIANLMLARATVRRRELTVRLALGASRGRLMNQLLVESFLLSLVSGVVGVLLASSGTAAVLAAVPVRLPTAAEIGLNWTVLAFAIAASGATALVVGIVAALRAARNDLRGALSETQRTTTAGGARVRNAFIAAQVALTLILVIGATLLGRSVLALLAVDPGYRTEGAIVLDVPLTLADDDPRRVAFQEQLLARLSAVSGVQEVGAVTDVPLGGNYPNGTFLILSRPDDVTTFDDFRRLSRDPSLTGSAAFRVSSEGYFRAMGIPLVRGRLFEDRDTIDAPHVALISESLARTRWPGEDPLGRLIQFGNMDGDLRPFTIVGIVGDVRETGLDGAPQPMFYGYYRQRPQAGSRLNIVLAGVGSVQTVIPAARQVVRELDPQLAPRFRTIEQMVSSSLADRRFSLMALTLFGGVALLLALAGIYSVITFLTVHRTQEIGIRMAIGATRSDVLAMMLRQGLAPTCAGIAIGLIGAAGTTRYLAAMLYGLTPVDALTFAAVGLAFALVATLASSVPAWRATKVDPLIALRYE